MRVGREAVGFRDPSFVCGGNHRSRDEVDPSGRLVGSGCTDLDSANAERERLDELIAGQDAFYEEFAGRDGEVYADGEVPKRNSELTGLPISVFSRCEECMATAFTEHWTRARRRPSWSRRSGVIGGGSGTYPTARYAFEVTEERAVLEGRPGTGGRTGPAALEALQRALEIQEQVVDVFDPDGCTDQSVGDPGRLALCLGHVRR